MCFSVLFYINKAIHRMDNERLLIKLEPDGIRGVPFDSFRSYSSNRYHSVKKVEPFSCWAALVRGGPQATTVGLLVFS